MSASGHKQVYGYTDKWTRHLILSKNLSRMGLWQIIFEILLHVEKELHESLILLINTPRYFRMSEYPLCMQLQGCVYRLHLMAAAVLLSRVLAWWDSAQQEHFSACQFIQINSSDVNNMRVKIITLRKLLWLQLVLFSVMNLCCWRFDVIFLSLRSLGESWLAVSVGPLMSL